MLDKRPDLLHGPQDALIAYLVTEVIPTLRTVNRDTTANYYHKLRGEWSQAAGRQVQRCIAYGRIMGAPLTRGSRWNGQDLSRV